jgi:DNA-binding PadR family transcriptional regulator
MADSIRMTYLTGVVLHAIASGHRYGFDIMDATGIPDGTVYPALRRLTGAGLLESRWEDKAEATAAHRPPRRYYRLTDEGTAAWETALERFPGIAHTFGPAEPDPSGA